MKWLATAALVFCSLSAYGAERIYLLDEIGGSGLGLRSIAPLEGARKLAVPDSGKHVLVLTAAGQVKAWGNNRAGQLGVGDTEVHQDFVDVMAVAGATAVAAGSEFSAALRNDGTVWLWGWGKATPEPVAGLWDIVRIAAGDDFLLAVRSDGAVWSVGREQAAKQVEGLWDVTAVAAAGSTRYARDVTGRLWQWKDGSPALAAGAGKAEARLAGAAPDWRGLAIRIDGNELRVGETRHPFSGSMVDLAEGWTVAMITTDRGASANAEEADAAAASTSARESAKAAPKMAAFTAGRFSSSSPLISAFETHSHYVQGGIACAWGINSNGELGDGTAVKRLSPVQTAAMSSLTVISSGLYHGAGLKSDGTVYTWGYNAYGQLGDGTTNHRPTPFSLSGLSGIVSVSAGSYHTMLLKNDGTVWAFGYNGYGELGDGTVTNRTTAVQVIGLSSVVAISAGNYYSVALKSDGSVWTWGRNDNGNLGDGTFTNRTSPVQVTSISGVSAIAAGLYHTLVLKTDGTVWGFGYNGYGGLGDGSTTTRTTAVRAGTLTGAVSIGSGEYHSLVVKSDGTVWTFGRNSQGQLGDGTITNRTTPVQVSGFSNAVRAVGGSLHSVAAKSDGSIWAWGDNANGQLGNGGTTDSTVPTATSACPAEPGSGTGPTPGTSFRSISANQTHSLATKPDGTSFGFGLNTNGEIGDGTSTNRNIPSQTTGLTGVTHVSSGLYHGAARLSNGTVRTWGYNAYGELGDGTNVSKTSPVTASGLSGVVSVAAGAYHTLALKGDGTVWGMGYNGYGELGDGSSTNRNVPVQVVGLTNVIAIGAGSYYSAALKSDGTVWTWGRNSNGNLGDGSYDTRFSPVRVAQMSGAVAISAGDFHLVILRNDGTVWSTGYGGYGQLGDGANDYRPNIVRASGLTNVIAIAAGESHTLYVKSDGTVWSSGRNQVGQLGIGNVANSLVPVQTSGGLSGVVAVAAGSAHSLALKGDGSIWVWGTNAQGQFGITTPASSTVPIQGPTGFGPYTPASPASIAIVSGSGQSTNVSSAFASPLVVVVRDAGSNPLSGVTVTFTPPGSGASATFAGGVNTAVTNGSGQATSAALTANATAGTYNVTASVVGLGSTVSFTLTNNSVGSGPGLPSNPSPADTATGVAATASVSWTAALGATSYDVYFSTAASPTFVANVTATSYNPGPLSLGTTYFWKIVPKNGFGSNTASAVWRFTTTTGSVTSGLRFVPVVPCRIADTRTGQGFTGNFGPPTLNAGAVRDLPIPSGVCGIPAAAKAYSFNVTVVPAEPLSYLTMWPTGQTQPLVSTLNSFHGGVVANAAIVPAGTSGSVSVYVTNRTDVIVDINGYFDDVTSTAYSFYAIDPCRLADTRAGSGFSGAFGQPTPTANTTRSFPLPGNCGLPSAGAYSLNITVVPPGPLSYLTSWPSGQTRPLVSTLNSFDGAIVANAAIVPAGTGGAVSTFVTDTSDQIIDVNGYFGASGGANELRFNQLTPCRVVDTRISGQGAPIMNGATQRDFPVTGLCGVPADAKAFSLNVTVVPTSALSYLTLWPAGKARPLVSTLNSFLGRVVANAAIAPAGTGGQVSVFVTDQTHVILDINGYFR